MKLLSEWSRIFLLLSLINLLWVKSSQSAPMTAPHAADRSMLETFRNHVNVFAEYINYNYQLQRSSAVMSCKLCKIILLILEFIVSMNLKKDQTILLMTSLCTMYSIRPTFLDQCYGSVKSYIHQFEYVIKNVTNNISINNICGFFVDGACIYQQSFLPVFNWQIQIPPKQTSQNPPADTQAPLSSIIKILHISDTHWDKDYLEGSIVNCNEILCCRPNVTAVRNQPTKYAGKYGGPNSICDIPRITMESMLEFATNNLTFDSVYWTGDIQAHDIWNFAESDNLDAIQSTCRIVRGYINTTNTVFPTLGNHDSELVDSFPVPSVYQEFNNSKLYNKINELWSDFIPTINHSTILKGGYYAQDVKPGFRLISLNMNYCLRGNFHLLIQSQDPTEQLQWLVQQLDECEKRNIKVHIIGHVPPGWCAFVWGRNYHDILIRYKQTIAGHFYGHTHNDEFEVIYDNNEPPMPISVAFIGPSVTSYRNLNPSFRIYSVDTSTWQVIDYDGYYLDLEEANRNGYATWKLLYTAKSEYNMTDLSPVSFNKFVQSMETDEALFQKFYSNYVRFPNSSCSGTSKSNILCGLKIDWSGRNTRCSGGDAQIF